MFTVDVNFAEQREGDAVGGAAEGLNLFFTARLLAEELVAGEPQHAEALGGKLLLQILELLILRRQAAFRGYIDDQQHLAGKGCQGGFLAINGRHFGIQNVMLHSLSSMDKPVSGEGDPYLL